MTTSLQQTMRSNGYIQMFKEARQSYVHSQSICPMPSPLLMKHLIAKLKHQMFTKNHTLRTPGSCWFEGS